jgi:hypothetical protein
MRSFLSGVDKRHARSIDITSKTLLARAELYRAFGRALDILIAQFGSYKVQANGQFIFSSQLIADRYTAAATETNAAAKRVTDLENEGKQLLRSQQEGWERFTSGK